MKDRQGMSDKQEKGINADMRNTDRQDIDRNGYKMRILGTRC